MIITTSENTLTEKYDSKTIGLQTWNSKSLGFLPFIYNNVLQNLLLTPIEKDKDFEKSLTNLNYFFILR